MTDELEQQLAEKACEVAQLLNAVVDDDERERLQELYERRLNDELYHGSEMRAAHIGPCPSCGGLHGPECLALPPEYRRTFKSITRGARVRHGDGREGRVVGFHTERVWSFRDRTSTLYARVDTDCGTEGALWPVADLTVLEPALERSE